MPVRDERRAWDSLKRELEYLQTHEVRVGVLTGPAESPGGDAQDSHGKGLTVASVFSFHEYGTRENYSDGPVVDGKLKAMTKKHRQSLHRRLERRGKTKRKPPSKRGKSSVPRRSSLAWAMEHRAKEIAAIVDRVVAAVMSGKISGRVGLGLVGEKILSLAKNRIKAGIPPALQDSTILAKSRAGNLSEKPLINTGQMINSLRYAIRSTR